MQSKINSKVLIGGKKEGLDMKKIQSEVTALKKKKRGPMPVINL